MLTFFWEKFGIREEELRMKPARWVQEMLMISSAENEALENDLDDAKRQRNNLAPPGKGVPGKSVKTTLMEF